MIPVHMSIHEKGKNCHSIIFMKIVFSPLGHWDFPLSTQNHWGSFLWPLWRFHGRYIHRQRVQRKPGNKNNNLSQSHDYKASCKQATMWWSILDFIEVVKKQWGHHRCLRRKVTTRDLCTYCLGTASAWGDVRGQGLVSWVVTEGFRASHVHSLLGQGVCRVST